MAETRSHAAPPHEMAYRGMHDRVMLLVLREVSPGPGVRVLDIGAGQGSLSAKLLEAGYSVSACDAYPDMFRLHGVECRRVDAAGRVPYDDGSFDLAISVEVVEHLESHRSLFTEVNRLLKEGGKFVFTTPNILSFKSRLRFFLTGYHYSFGPLDPTVEDPVTQHITPFTLDRYRFLLSHCGLDLTSISADKLQRTSLAWAWMTPVVRLWAAWTFGRGEGVSEQNSRTALFGRTLFAVARKKAGAGPATEC